MADRPRDLLFGLLTVQLKVFRPFRLEPVCEAWEQNPDTPLAEHFLEAELLTEEDARLIHILANALIEQQGGSVEATLEALGGVKYAEQLLGLSEAETVGESDFATRRASDTFFQRIDLQKTQSGEGPGRYTLVREQARGGMGRILVVYDDRLERQVALKELLPEGSTSTPGTHDSPRRYTASLAARFIREAQVAGRLEHPSIVPVYELGETAQGALYYTMKLVRGTTLHDALKKRKTLGDRLQLLSNFENLCQAIAYAHSRGVIHRDIKPANVMLGEFGETVVLDWGIAKIKSRRDLFKDQVQEKIEELQRENDSPDSKTREGGVLGTPHYMSPEQARGEVGAIDERSDVYSLGAVLYEILTGQTPYRGKSTHDILRKVMENRFEPVLEAVPDTPPELAVICEKALSKEAGKRYQTAMELAEDIHRFVTGTLVNAYKYSLREILTRYYRRHRAAMNTAAASLLILAISGAYSYVSILQARNEEHRQRIVAEEARQKESAAHQQAEHQTYLTQLGLIQAAIQAQDYAMANQVAEQVNPKQRGWEWGYLVNRANPELRTIETPGFRVGGVTLSPDGKKAAAACVPGMVKIWNLESGATEIVCEGNAILTEAAVFSHDGARLAGAGDDGAVYVWTTDSGKLLFRLTGHGTRAGCVAFSLDDARLLSGADNGELRLWDMATGAAIATVDTGLGSLYAAYFVPGDGILVLTGASTMEGTIRLYNADASTPGLAWQGQQACVSGDGKRVAVASAGRLGLYALPSGDTVREWPIPENEMARVRFNGSASRLLVAGHAGTAWLLDTETGETLHTFEHGAPVENTAFTRDDAVVVTCGRDNTFAAWDTRTGYLLNRMAGRGRSLTCVDFSRDGTRMLNSTSQGFFQVWDPLYQTGRRLVSSRRSISGKLCLAERAAVIGTSNAQDSVSLMQLDGHACRVLFGKPLGRYGPRASLGLSKDASRFVAALDGFVPTIWESERNSALPCFGHKGDVKSVAFDEPGARFVSASSDGTACVWDAASGKLLATLEGRTDPVWSACFSADGAHILSTSQNGAAMIWDAASGQCLQTLKGHEGPVYDAAFSPDDQRCYTASADRSIRVWDTASGKELNVLRGHGGRVMSISLSTDGRYLVSASDDGTSRLWDTDSCESLLTLAGIYGGNYLASTAELVTCSTDGLIERWEGLPGPQAPSGVEEHLAAFRTADYAKTCEQLLPAPVPEHITLALSSQVFADSMKALAELLQAETAQGAPDFGEAGLCLTAGPRTQLLCPLGFEPGDRLVQANGVPLDTRAAAIAAFEQLAANPNPSTPGEWGIARYGQRVPVRIVVVESRNQDSACSLGRDAANKLLELVNSSLHRNPDVAAGSPIAAQGILLETNPEGREEERQLMDAGLADFDHLFRLDAKAFVDTNDAVARLKTLMDAVAQGTAGSFSFDVRRGTFLTCHIEYLIK